VKYILEGLNILPQIYHRNHGSASAEDQLLCSDKVPLLRQT